MNLTLRNILTTLSALTLTLSGVSHAQSKKELTIGATAGSNSEVLRLGISPQLERKGYKVKIVEFNDYVQPNLALANGALDLNYFQHIIYLKKFAADQKLDIVDVVQGPIAPLGIYSTKRKSLSEIKKGDRISFPNDPVNLARALILLQANKILTVKSDVDPLRVAEKDIVANPFELKLIPLEAAQLPRSQGDVDYAIINGNFAISSGLKLTEAVALEKVPDYYLLVVAARRADKDTPWARDVAQAFKTPEFKAVLDRHFPGYARPTFLQ